MAARVLIIEDNPANLELARYLLDAHGYPTFAAVDGEAGFRMFRELHPDVVLCDLQLPLMDGYEVLSKIRNDTDFGDTIVIAVTAFSMPGDRTRAVSAGFDGYIPKPIEPTTFVQQIEGFLSPELRAMRPGAGS